MPLQSEYLKGDTKLEAAAVSHAAHIMPKTRGDHVGKLQRVLITLDGAAIAEGELSSAMYGETTAAAVLAYKDSKDGRRPKIINKAYQTKADDITGIMTMTTLDREMFARQLADPDADFIGFSTGQIVTIKDDIARAKQMLDVVLRRLRSVARVSPNGTLLITPRSLEYYDTKLKVNNIFHINTFEPEDEPVPDGIMPTLRKRFRGLQELPTSTNPAADAINFAVLLQNMIRLRQSLDQRFIKESYRQSTFRGTPLGFFSAFVDAQRPNDPTVRITKRYFDASIMPSRDDRAVTLAHERAHTIFRAGGHPGTGDNPFCVAPHEGDPNVQRAEQALANPYCYEWLMRALQPDYNGAAFRGPECGT